MRSFTISGQYVDLFHDRIFPAAITVKDGRIAAIQPIASAPEQFILPGFVDAHIHIESSMLVPSSFARVAVVHGTVATVSDPHEIANVCGIGGVQFMIENARLVPFKCFFGAPSCVPATAFETAGATLDADAVAGLLQNPDIWYLSEMMNYPGVLFKDAEVMRKIDAAHAAGKPVDGHAPGLRGEQAAQYAGAGITTDHECYTLEEALEKIGLGMHILIREGSAARNYAALAPLLRLHPDKVMLCSDDKHPDELVLGHINLLVKRALEEGYDLFDVLRAACVNPVLHYKIPVGLLREGDPADFIVVSDLNSLQLLQTYVDGEMVAAGGKSLIPFHEVTPINQFHAGQRKVSDFVVVAPDEQPMIRVIEALEGQLITNELVLPAVVENGCIVSDLSRDILKIAVVNRYNPAATVALGFIRNMGLKAGAIASSVGHDCHNIIVVGVDDEAMCSAVNALIDVQGGIAVALSDGSVPCLPLPVGGLMSVHEGQQVAEQYTAIDLAAHDLGTKLRAPFMTLSFMPLLVIPALKLSDKGLFSGSSFSFTPLIVSE